VNNWVAIFIRRKQNILCYIRVCTKYALVRLHVVILWFSEKFSFSEFLHPSSPACAKIWGQTGANIFGHTSPADWNRELFKPSKDAERHVFRLKRNGKLWIWSFCG